MRLFDFGKASSIAFRADIDALPITERSGVPYASSHPGRMHACGHDGHTAILLELARRLNARKELPHNVLLVFQPAEEPPAAQSRSATQAFLKNTTRRPSSACTCGRG